MMAWRTMLAGVLVATAASLAWPPDLDEPASEDVAKAVEDGVVTPIEVDLLFHLDSSIRVQQELVFAELFGENVLIGNLYDESCRFDAFIDPDFGYGTGLGAATTDDGRSYSIESPVLAESAITLENGYEPEWVVLAQPHAMRFYAVWAMLRSDQNSTGVPVLGVQAEYQQSGVDFCRFFVLRRLDATPAQFDAAWERAETIGLRASSGLGCTNAAGNPLIPDAEYELCVQAALDDYNTKMKNRTRGFTARGGLGILIVTGGGIACIAFPPSCPLAVSIAIGSGLGVLYDGVDAWADFAAYGDDYDNALRDCCRGLQLRQ